MMKKPIDTAVDSIELFFNIPFKVIVWLVWARRSPKTKEYRVYKNKGI
jgi:hypothetical protein